MENVSYYQTSMTFVTLHMNQTSMTFCKSFVFFLVFFPRYFCQKSLHMNQYQLQQNELKPFQEQSDLLQSKIIVIIRI